MDYRGNYGVILVNPSWNSAVDIAEGDRICQFEIVPNQFATIWQKLKWLFSSKIEFEWVDTLHNADRGGFGSTGVK